MDAAPRQSLDFTHGVSFHDLAKADKDFAAVYARKKTADWQSPEFVKQLTKSTLKVHFNLNIELPDNRLCPPVPNRFLYIKWIQDLIDSTSASFSDGFDRERLVLGVDIGVGASCIYPLLGCATRSNWFFKGTDIDEQNLGDAEKNIHANNMDDRIGLYKSEVSGPILPFDDMHVYNEDFTMCNPPFYSSPEDLASSSGTKQGMPSAVCTGSEVEMITEGGELAFVCKILQESRQYSTRVQWFTSMFGKLESLIEFVQHIKDAGITNWALGVLAPGQHTKRWVVGWSFGDLRPAVHLARPEADFASWIGKSIYPFPTEQGISLNGRSNTSVAQFLNSKFVSLDVEWRWEQQHTRGILHAADDVWSRHARRKLKAIAATGDFVSNRGASTRSPGLVVRIVLTSDMLVVRWLKGGEQTLFESFCGFTKRQVESVGPTTTTSDTHDEIMIDVG